MYFACMTMTTVGYGDIQPKNPIEYLGCIGIMVIKQCTKYFLVILVRFVCLLSKYNYVDLGEHQTAEETLPEGDRNYGELYKEAQDPLELGAENQKLPEMHA